MDIRFTDCSVSFGERVALHPVTLALDERRIGIIGLNGSGKTTFARLINGLVKPSTGHVKVNGLDTVADGRAVLAEAGFIFQNPQHQLIMPIVADDIAFGLKNRGLPVHEISSRTDAADRLHLEGEDRAGERRGRGAGALRGQPSRETAGA